MAPEQASRRDDDPRTDIYALGTVLYRILAGKLPFRANSLARHMALLLTAPPTPLPDVTPGGEVIPAELKRLVHRCLEKAPEKRPQSMTVLAELLRPFEDNASKRVAVAEEPYQMGHIEAALEAIWSADPVGPRMIGADEVELVADEPLADESGRDERGATMMMRELADDDDEPLRTRADRPLEPSTEPSAQVAALPPDLPRGQTVALEGLSERSDPLAPVVSAVFEEPPTAMAELHRKPRSRWVLPLSLLVGVGLGTGVFFALWPFASDVAIAQGTSSPRRPPLRSPLLCRRARYFPPPLPREIRS